MTAKRMLSAQVVLRSRAPSGAGTNVTTKNVHEYLPEAETVAVARRAFEEAGFEVGPIVANSFAITAPRTTFEKTFKVKLRGDERQGVKAVARRGGGASHELPLDACPPALAGLLDAVTFSPPPDFGPTNY